MTEAVAGTRAGRVALAYLELTKPRIVMLVLVTGVPSLLLAAHSWQPVPALVASAYCGADHVSRFTERDCASGALGLLPAQELMPILMANALRFAKYGA